TTVISQINTAAGNRQYISLASNTVDVTDPNGDTDYATLTEIKAPKSIICQAPTPSSPVAWTTLTTFGVGMNVSSPLGDANYYEEPLIAGPMSVTTGLAGTHDYIYADPNAAGTPLARDDPMDTGFTGMDSDSDEPTTYPASHTANLQRLANPGLPHNPMPSPPPATAADSGYNASLPVNPYITIDTMPIDLTVFNNDFAAGDVPGDVTLRTRERGDTDYNIWKPASAPSPVTTNNYTSYNFGHNLVHSLGFLKSTASMSYKTTTGVEGDPSTPFPWLAWNDRPFISEFELLQVPASSPELLTTELSISTGTDNDFYTTYSNYPFGHLLNFFNSGGSGAELARVFDFLHVPSLYTGSHTVFHPKNFSDASENVSRVMVPPYNLLSQYREPGRINLNTIFHQNIYEGLLDEHGGPTW
ncbi:MAG: hypothetical protein N2C12_03255, partial [Planctomycetales bacterium]